MRRESVASMSDIVLAISPDRDTLLDLTRKMRQHAEEIFTRRDIRLRHQASFQRARHRYTFEIRRESS